jgi:hypothetical protein
MACCAAHTNAAGSQSQVGVLGAAARWALTYGMRSAIRVAAAACCTRCQSAQVGWALSCIGRASASPWCRWRAGSASRGVRGWR